MNSPRIEEPVFNSIRNIFIHALNATDYWLGLLQNDDQRPKKKFEEYNTLEEIDVYMQQVERRMHDYLGLLSPENLKKKYEVEGAGNLKH